MNPEYGFCEYVEECQAYSQEVDVGRTRESTETKAIQQNTGSFNVYVRGGWIFFFFSFFSEHNHIDVCEQSPQTDVIWIVLNLVFLRQKHHFISELR